MTSLLRVLLSVAVCVANAYCACADLSVASHPPADRRAPNAATACHGCAPAQSGCRGGAPTGTTPCHSDDPAHNCGHCTGTVTADTTAKTVLPPVVCTPFAVTISAWNGETPVSISHRFEHAG